MDMRSLDVVWMMQKRRIVERREHAARILGERIGAIVALKDGFLFLMEFYGQRDLFLGGWWLELGVCSRFGRRADEASF